ncbi:LysR family transcriptional regulator [Altericroceibacterium endophyticum]|uniref:LysR family transcriptional regulator n=1 Tax=Altericroceibacterium endophyticum TaxID=1808508 RepID=A0A6I4T8S2_9SPHN|nr:LysR family transcriptional regulator [Altericroceibacterium endophyticum]MXO66433.1 LysR family transcriptional regulator [Altericroceibacterium endophyticum]
MATKRQLEVFLTIVRCGSFRKAADELHISEASVSKQMKALETAGGQPLFTRERGRPAQLSAQGQSILNVAKQTLALQEKLQGGTESAALPPSPKLIIRPFLMQSLIRPNLAKLHEAGWPKTASFTIVETTNEILSLLERDANAFAFFRGGLQERKGLTFSYLKESNASVFAPREVCDKIRSGLLKENEVPFITPQYNLEINGFSIEAAQETAKGAPLIIEIPAFIDQLIEESIKRQAKIFILDDHAAEAVSEGYLEVVKPKAKAYWFTLASRSDAHPELRDILANSFKAVI